MNLPKPKSHELIDRINALSEGEVNDAFIVNGIRRDAERLLSVDAFHANVVLGAVASIQGKHDVMHACHKKSLALYPNSLLAIVNYATSLSRTGFLVEARQYIRRARELYPDNIAVLRQFIDLSIESGRLRDALVALAYWDKLKPTESFSNLGSLRDSVQFLEEFNITDDDVENVFEVQQEIIRKHTLPNFTVSLWPLDDSEARWIARRVFLSKTVEEVVGLNIELAEKLAASDFDPKITASVVSMFAVA